MTAINQILNEKMIEIENEAADQMARYEENLRIAKLIAPWHRAERREFKDRAAANMARFEYLKDGWNLCKLAKAGERNEAYQWAAGIRADAFQKIIPGFEDIYQNGELDAENEYEQWANRWEVVNA